MATTTRRRYKALSGQAADMSHDAATIAGEAINRAATTARRKAHDAGEVVRHAANDAYHRGEDVAHDVARIVRQRPISAALAAAGILVALGFAARMILRR